MTIQTFSEKSEPKNYRIVGKSYLYRGNLKLYYARISSENYTKNEVTSNRYFRETLGITQKQDFLSGKRNIRRNR